MLQTSVKKNYHFYGAMIVVGLYTVVPFLLLSIYNHPSVDDFEFAVRDNQNNFFVTQLDTYHNWSGRYFATAFSQLNPARFKSIAGYKVFSLLLLLTFIGVLHTFISTLFNKFTLKQKANLTALFTVLYISQMPSVAQGLFWMSGYQTYQIPNIMTLGVLILLIKLFKSKSKTTRIACTIGIILMNTAIIGSNEISLAYLVAFFAFILLLLWHHQHQLYKHVLVVFVLCLLATFIMVSAPGNYVRMGLLPDDAGNIVWAVLASILLIPTYFYKWGILLTVGSMLYLLFLQRTSVNTANFNRIFNISLPLSILYFLTTLFLMNFAYTFSVGAVPIPRVENVIYFFFVLGWFYNLQVGVTKFHYQFQQTRVPSILSVALMILFLRLVLDINNNISTAYLDVLSGKAKVYNKELNQRYSYLKKSSCDVCFVEPLSALPKSLFVGDVTTNPEERDLLVNRAFREYWHKEGIYLSASNPIIEEENLETLRSIGSKIKHQLLKSKEY